MNLTPTELRELLREATDQLQPPVFHPDLLMSPRRPRFRVAVLGLAATAAAVAVALGVVAIAQTQGPADRLVLSPAQGRGAVTPACPSTFAAAGDVANDRREAVSQLVPATPTGGRLCRYASALAEQGDGAGPIEADAQLSRQEALQLADILNQIKTVEGVRHCPVDTETYDILYFTYERGPSVEVRINTSGCTSFTNGLITLGGTSPESYAYRATADEILADSMVSQTGSK